MLPRGGAIVMLRLLVLVTLAVLVCVGEGFISGPVPRRWQQVPQPSNCFTKNSRTPPLHLAYIPPEKSEQRSTNENTTAFKTKKPIFPKLGDVVRYFDLDGGKVDGEVLVGKLTFITRLPNEDGTTKWLAEVTELEHVGDCYYAEYSSPKRMGRKRDRDLRFVSPILASFVQTEQAYKLPINEDGIPIVRQEAYDLDDWKGPQSPPVRKEVLAQDGIAYDHLKTVLAQQTVILGLVTTILIEWFKGPEDAIIYCIGALASVGYLYLLSLKTDTMFAPQDAKIGNQMSDFRFLLPACVVVAIALYNQFWGQNVVDLKDNFLGTVSTEQFTMALAGFLTYRVPLILGQLLPEKKT